jgi:hypothetical protein
MDRTSPLPLMLKMLLIVLLSAPVACRLPGAAEDQLVTGFRFEPEAFDSFTGSASIHYTLSRPAVTTLRIFMRGKNEPLIVLFESLRESKGTHEHTWLGDTEEGYFAPAGNFRGILDAEGEQFEAVVRVYHR